jgi:ABC-type uncharacterized transport system substrate-binding protein
MARRLELLREAVPGVSRVAVLLNPAHPAAATHLRETQAAAQGLGVELLILEVRSAAEFAGAFAAMTTAGAGALLVFPDPALFDAHPSDLTALALTHRVPAIYPWRLYADAGGLMIYGTSLAAQYRRAAYYVDRILRGAKPADLPVEQPMQFELVINLQTAKVITRVQPTPSSLRSYVAAASGRG